MCASHYLSLSSNLSFFPYLTLRVLSSCPFSPMNPIVQPLSTSGQTACKGLSSSTPVIHPLVYHVYHHLSPIRSRSCHQAYQAHLQSLVAIADHVDGDLS